MATQVATFQPTHRPLRTLSPRQKRLIGKAQLLVEYVRACHDSTDVAEFRQMHQYLTQFLALPADVLQAWEELPDSVLEKLRGDD